MLGIEIVVIRITMSVCLERPLSGQGYQLKNSESFKGLYDAYSAAIFGEILRIVKHKETSEDLLQDVFLTIFQTLHGECNRIHR